MPHELYVFATAKPWNLAAFTEARPRLAGEWVVATTPADLHAVVTRTTPRYVFFPHWSSIVPTDIVNNVECVCFHMTDVPYGRGGSPLQNLVVRGHRETKMTALRMTDVVDGGPVYLKRPLSLDGSASEIFTRAAPLILEMIEWIIEYEPDPVAQEGTPTAFARRTPAESRLPRTRETQALYDHIRMLDAPGYPPAFLTHDGWRLEFGAAQVEDGAVTAQVRFTPDADGTT